MSRPFIHGTKHAIEQADALILWFCDERERAERLDSGLLEFEVHDDRAEETWPKVREAALKMWIESHPGTRPHFWWACDAPADPRRLISGAGSPELPGRGFGIPFLWRGYSAADPPIFESEGSYVQRHGLLEPGEAERADFRPEAIDDRDAWTSYGLTYFKKHSRFICVW